MITNRRLLTSLAYPDERNLGFRQDLYRFQHPSHDLTAIAVRELAGTTGTVVDVGCGNGRYLARLRRDRPDIDAVGLDLSAGMLRDVPPPVLVADASRLPLRTSAAGAVLAMHMLYHLVDIAAAARELRRVLAPGGVLLAATNATTDKAELHHVWDRANARMRSGSEVPRISFSGRFPLEEAPGMLGTVFDDIRVIELESAIVVDRAEPVVAYFASFLPSMQVAGDRAEAFRSAVRDEVTARIQRSGRLHIGCRSGILVCR